MSPVLYGIGVGPGDPELLTLKAKRMLESVRVVAVPRSDDMAESLALEVVRQVVDLRGKEIVELIFPMRKQRQELAGYWREAARKVFRYLAMGEDVAFITLGDPLFHSTFIYLMDSVKQGEGAKDLEIKVIPGVSSINASAASAGIPLARSDERVTILPATYKPERLRDAFNDSDTIVLMKVNRVMDRVLSLLKDYGLEDNAFFISRAGWEDEEVIRGVEGLKGKRFGYLSLVIVRKDLTGIPT